MGYYFHGIRFKNIDWFCDKCGALLNKQAGFTDIYDAWRCRKCGYYNDITDDNIVGHSNSYYDEDEDDDEDENDDAEYEDDDENENDDDDDNNGGYPVNINIGCFPSMTKIVLFLIVLGFLGYLYFKHTNTISIQNSPNDIIGKNYEEVEKIFQDYGFKSIWCEPIYDLEYSERNMEKTVKSVEIDEKNIFEKDATFLLYSKVIIKYHTLKKIPVTISSKTAEDYDNYLDLYQLFQNAGFVNIEVQPDYDLITGWIDSRFSVEQVIINGRDEFDANDYFRPDDKVIIIYHAFKRDRPD